MTCYTCTAGWQSKFEREKNNSNLLFSLSCVRTYLVLGERSECVIIILSCVVGSWLDASEVTFFPMDDLEAPLLPSGYLARSTASTAQRELLFSSTYERPQGNSRSLRHQVRWHITTHHATNAAFSRICLK